MKKQLIHMASLLTVLSLAFSLSSCSKADKKQKKKTTSSLPKIKVGYIVKELYSKFSTETIATTDKFAALHNVEIIVTTAKTNKALLVNMDKLHSEGAESAVISAPNPDLGPVIYSRAERLGLKVIAVKNRLLNIDGSYLNKVPYIGLSVEKTGNVITKVVLETLKNSAVDLSTTGILFLKSEDNSIFQECLEEARDRLKQNNIPEKSIFICNTIPAPDSVIASNEGLARIKDGDYKTWIIFGFNAKMTSKVAELVATKYRHTLKDIHYFTVRYARNTYSKNETSENLIGFLYINPEKIGYSAIDLAYKWITKGEKPPATTGIKPKFIKNPNYWANK
ncbi:MAG: hypothetical protein K9L78_01375 [Victivallales bacterium]|nr:hypothetical protein [Victivallales bacterium]MCF7888748.1 hypothetical protein [Victivallales bacterium]